MADEAMDDIVVTGRKMVQPDGSFYQHNRTQNVWRIYKPLASGGYTKEVLPGSPSDVDDNPNFGVDAVKIEAADLENPLLVAAAANVVRTINIVMAALTAANQTELVQIGNKSMTVGQLRTFLSKSTFTVTDRTFTNGGYGKALPNGVGGGTFEWNYQAFDGDPLNSGGMDYAHPNYTNNAGMNAVLLHDVAHATEGGKLFNAESHEWFNNAVRDKLMGRGATFNNSEFWLNNERLAHDVARLISTAAGINIAGWTPLEGFGAMRPEIIYNNLKNR